MERGTNVVTTRRDAVRHEVLGPSCKQVVDRRRVGSKRSIARTIISHRLKVQTDEIGQQECILIEVPGAIANRHGIRVVIGVAWGGETVCRRHGGDNQRR